jgi:hypothetical protein
MLGIIDNRRDAESQRKTQRVAAMPSTIWLATAFSLTSSQHISRKDAKAAKKTLASSETLA